MATACLGLEFVGELALTGELWPVFERTLHDLWDRGSMYRVPAGGMWHISPVGVLSQIMPT
jgi:hypothetical protein